MAGKTITIDLAAYEALASRKRAGQSFSDVIKLHFRAGHTARDLLDVLQEGSPSEETADRIEEVRRARRRSPARAARR